ncbi:aspartate/glutamate racemase family protein [Actinomadura sp. ATCC 31491]|uniref:Aspartate/glutamate racemase family protein n=1 Tax=Actinomadura luzonensis TaxID=2805427 RepID=A0ABT0FW41_9ACTN|nr:aspartate/glutamate racemase family protein [Actinomadura luzonensis]MCK2216195.1 aspartate/glutamate racemase family protein [Actinomadura luzonensis]
MSTPTGKIAMLHTVPALAAPLGELAAEVRPGAQIVHFADESLLQDTIAHGGPPPHVLRRLVAYAAFAKESGAETLLVTCSSIGEAAERARPFAELPILRIDQPMAEEAVATGERVGVLATLATTLGPTTRAVRRAAARRGLRREIVPHLCEGAFEALRAGDAARHDALVLAGFGELAGKADVVVLAQASMARIVTRAAAGVPVLSSPRSGVAQLARPPAEG